MQRQPRWRIGEAIPPASRAVLQRLGLWEAFLAQDHLPSAGSCASWGGPDLGYNDFLLDMQGKGWHLDRVAFDAMLSAAVAARGGTIVRGLRLRDAERREAGGGYVWSFEDEERGHTRVTTDFLVDATGIAASAVRRLDVARNQVDCLAVLSAVFDLAEPDAVPSQALLEACEYGWWYAAKIPRRRLIAAVAVEPSDRWRFNEIRPFLSALRAMPHTAHWLERGQAPPVNGLALNTALAPSAILSRVVGERWLAVGDAASAYDPIAAQGIVKALCDGEAAGEAIADFLAGAGEARLMAYQDGVFGRFTDCLRLHQHFYRLERRWPQSPFWRNRLFRL
jgi:flavin-dependent dehydrogenase